MAARALIASIAGFVAGDVVVLPVVKSPAFAFASRSFQYASFLTADASADASADLSRVPSSFTCHF